MKTTNSNIKDRISGIYCGRGKGININPKNCKIGESGWLGNPISVNKVCSICNKIHTLGGDTLKCYELYLRNRLKHDNNFAEAFFKLKGQNLVCFCKPNPCHTDIMIDFIEGIKVV